MGAGSDPQQSQPSQQGEQGEQGEHGQHSEHGQQTSPDQHDHRARPHEVVVRRLGAGDSEIAVFEFQGELKDRLIESLRRGYLETGSYLPDAKRVSSQAASSLSVAMGSAGATALSAAASSSLFVATANPATLMTLGSGVGSAVMGAGGIVAQAPFIAVASSLPVVAPILAIQALNSAVVMHQFKLVDRKLDAVKRTLDRVLARIEATHVGELLAASWVIDDVHRQYEVGGAFSQDMLIRLASAERDARTLAARFRQLVETVDGPGSTDPADVQQANHDAHSAMLASFVELRIDYLRVCADTQENPRSVAGSIDNLRNRLEECDTLWTALLDRSRAMKREIEGLETALKEMNRAERLRPGFLGGEVARTEKELGRRTAAYTATLESERAITEGFHALIAAARDARRGLDERASEIGSGSGSGSGSSLVTWTDADGEHSFVTERVLVS